MKSKYSVAWVPKITQTKSKYKAQTTTIDGHKFDSKKEAMYYLKLKDRVAKGEITDLELQPKYLLQESYKAKDGSTVRAIHYIADFRYKEDGKVVVVDVKSRITEANPVYRLKRKMLGYHYPDLDFREVVM